MKRVFVLVVVVAIATLSVAQTHKDSSGSASVADEIKKLEQEWANAEVKGDAAAIPTYEATDIVSTDPSGNVTTLKEDVEGLKSGDFKVASLDYADMKVQVYGNAAVATGKANIKASYKGKDLSGGYRFTDTWVKRNGKWQCVATQVTKITQD